MVRFQVSGVRVQNSGGLSAMLGGLQRAYPFWTKVQYMIQRFLITT